MSLTNHPYRIRFQDFPPYPDPDPPLDLSRHSFDNPVWISPDWPPPCELDRIVALLKRYPPGTQPSRVLQARLGAFGLRWNPVTRRLFDPLPNLSEILAQERHLFGGNRPL